MLTTRSSAVDARTRSTAHACPLLPCLPYPPRVHGRCDVLHCTPQSTPADPRQRWPHRERRARIVRLGPPGGDLVAQRTKVKTISAEATQAQADRACDALKELMRSEGLTELEVAGRKVRLEVTCKEE